MAQQIKSLTLRANFSWMLVGNIIYSACQWGMLVAIAKLSTSSTVGLFTFGLALTAPVFMFTSLDLRQVQVTDTKHEYTHSDYLALRLLSTILGYITIFVIAGFIDRRLQTKLVILLVGTAKAFELISDMFYGILQEHERMDRIAKSMILKGILTCVAMAAGLALTHNIVWAVAGMTAVWIALLFLYDIPNTVKVVGHVERPRWDMNTMRRLTWVALPLGFMMLLVSLGTNIPRYFLERYAGESELGIFAALSYLIVAGRTVTVALGQAIVPRLASYYTNSKLSAFARLLLQAVGIGFLMGVAGVIGSLVLGKPVLTLLYKPEYAKHVDLLVWIMVAATLKYVEGLISYGLTATRFFAIKLPMTIYDTICVTVLSLLLIPSGGIRGATMAMVVASVFELIGTTSILLYTIRRDTKIRMKQQALSEPASSF